MKTDPVYLEMSFDKAGIRNSHKRLKILVEETAVNPLKEYQNTLTGKFDLVEEILLKRVATAIAYWCQHKHDPVAPGLHDMMSNITNTRRSDSTLAEFYEAEVTSGMYTLAPLFGLKIRDDYTVATDELEFSLLELEDIFQSQGISTRDTSQSANHNGNGNHDAVDEYPDLIIGLNEDYSQKEFATVAEVIPDSMPVKSDKKTKKHQRSITVTPIQSEIVEVSQEINLNVLTVTSEETWNTIYGLMGYNSEYIQEKMMPRWQQAPKTFEQDRRFLYNLFIQSIRNSAGIQVAAGNFIFADKQMSIDQLWQVYYTDLLNNVAPQLTAAQFDEVANQPWYKKSFRGFIKEFGNISPIWLLALVIALIFDGLTTYVSLDQTPMDGFMVTLFTILITALFQIADLLVINYRKREFDADAMSAKYAAKFEQYTKMLEGLDTTSESYVQSSLEKSRAQADWKAAEDSRKMSRRGRFWSARIADINIVVTAYGFSYMFLNAKEPITAIIEQLDYIFVQQTWINFDFWIFLMVGLAITVSFVINTAQRTEILGWSMRRLKKDA